MWFRLTLSSMLFSLCCYAVPARAIPLDDEAAVVMGKAALRRLPIAFRDKITVHSFADEEEHPASPARGRLTLIIGDSRKSQAYVNVTGGCRADLKAHEIRCDESTVDDIADELRLGDDAVGREEILSVMLAHELGHIMFKHTAPPYHGEGGTISVIAYAEQRQELEADAFAVELMDQTRDPIGGIYRLIEYLARTAEAVSLCPDVAPGSCTLLPQGPGLPTGGGGLISITLRSAHPDYVIRFIRMLYLSTNRRVQEVYSRDALFELRNMKVRDKNDTIQSLDPLLKRARDNAAVQERVRRLVRKHEIPSL